MPALPAPNSPSPSPSDPPLPLPLPPLPPPPPPPPPPPQPQKQVTPLSLYQIVISKQAHHVNGETRTPKSTPKIIRTKISTKQEPILRQTRPRRTNPVVWCCAILCLVFSLILIFFGIATLIIFLVVRPKVPLFDTTNARLSTVYFDSPEYLNGDFTFLANFSNPNRKLDIRFEYLAIDLYFADRLISTQSLQQFTQRPKETRLEAVRMISSLVYLPQNHAVELRTQVQSNRVNYNIRATFKVRATLGMLHFTYWLHSRCQLQMTGPPTGILVARSCRTKR